MKRVLRINYLIMPLLVLLYTCHKEETSMADESEYILFNESLVCQPLETENGFYFVALKDSLLKLVQLNQTGSKNELLNISSYMSVGLSYDSISKLKVTQLMNSNLMVSYTYREFGDDEVMVRALELTDSGTLVDELSVSIPKHNDDLYEYVGITKNDQNEWLVLSSHAMGTRSVGQVSEAILQSTVYRNSDEGVIAESSFQTMSQSYILSAYTLSNNYIVLILSNNQTNTPSVQTIKIEGFSMMAILPNGNIVQTSLNENLLSVELIKLENDEIVLVGSLERSVEQSKLLVSAYDANMIQQWANEISISSQFTALCIELTEQDYVIGGFVGEARDFNWNKIYEQTNTETIVIAYDYSGLLKWNKMLRNEFNTLATSISQKGDEYSCLLSKKSFNTYNNYALLKINADENLN